MENKSNATLSAELDLLFAMYPDQLSWNEQRRELAYATVSGSALTLRIDDDYPDSMPIVISALSSGKDDIREKVKTIVKHFSEDVGGEILDAILLAFEELHQSTNDTPEGRGAGDGFANTSITMQRFKTMIVWLHHLLNTNKRKLATNPQLDSSDIVGLTRPGYPGVLLYSGKASAVDAHVAALKDQRWQAFQVRLEEDTSEPWEFTHSSGIKEVETMSDITSAIVIASHKEAFLKAMHIK